MERHVRLWESPATAGERKEVAADRRGATFERCLADKRYGFLQRMMGTAPERHQRAKTVVVETPSEGKPSMGKSIRNLLTVTRVGLALAKRVFQVHAVDAKARSLGRANSRAAS